METKIGEWWAKYQPPDLWGNQPAGELYDPEILSPGRWVYMVAAQCNWMSEADAVEVAQIIVTCPEDRRCVWHGVWAWSVKHGKHDRPCDCTPCRKERGER
jgi:hypothetical protein